MIGGRPRIWTTSRKRVQGVVLIKELLTEIEIDAPPNVCGACSPLSPPIPLKPLNFLEPYHRNPGFREDFL
jgi:hypothetical protein